jgi:tripartite-type tricarboxylate transporter receptor subunit TctC
MVAKSPPDGLTMLFGVTGTHAVAPSLYPALPYQPLRDFAPITLVVRAPLVLVVQPALPIHSVADFIAAAKARPGALTYGTPGNGTAMHLTGVMFDQSAGTQTTHVPYRGSVPALNDLLGGTLGAMWGDLLVVLPQLRAGAIRALAVTSATRNPLLPEVPTVAESGLPGFEAMSWQGLFAPSATPPALVERLSVEIRAALDQPEIREFFAAQGFLVGGSTPAEFAAMVGTEITKWARVVRDGKVTAD